MLSGDNRDMAAARSAAVVFHAAGSTIEALAYSLRKGVDALSRPDVLDRLRELDGAQIRDMAARLLQRTVASSWTDDEVATLIAIWRKTNGR